MVEHDLAKVGVEGSNPFARSNEDLVAARRPPIGSPSFDVLHQLLARAVVILFAVALDDLDEMVGVQRQPPAGALDTGKICGGWPVA